MVDFALPGLPESAECFSSQMTFDFSPARFRGEGKRFCSGNDDDIYDRKNFCGVGEPGFEPGTSRSQTVRATRLRHSPQEAKLYADIFKRRLFVLLVNQRRWELSQETADFFNHSPGKFQHHSRIELS